MSDDVERVHHVVDGKIVPKPDNQRIPGRRYRHEVNVSTGEAKTIELTNEEEAQHDAKERQWEAGRPKREAEAAQQKTAAEAYRASLRYEPRVVAFIDVLGWRTAVQRSITEPELVPILGLSLTAIEGHVKLNYWPQDQFPDDLDQTAPEITQFSDSLIISVRPSPAGVMRLTSVVHSLSWAFMRHGLWLRGGIALGPVYHRKDLAFGPAMIEAYDLEHNHAVNPRIVLSDTLAERLGQGERISSPEGEINFKTWRLDARDGRRFFDFLQPLGAMTGRTPLPFVSTPHFTTARTAIERGLATFKDEKIQLKYRWLADYFNSVIAEYSLLDIKPL